MGECLCRVRVAKREMLKTLVVTGVVALAAVGIGVGVYFATTDNDEITTTVGPDTSTFPDGTTSGLVTESTTPILNTTTMASETTTTTTSEATSSSVPDTTTPSKTTTTSSRGPRPETPKTPTNREDSRYPWTPLDEYVWKEDPTYHYEILPGYPVLQEDVDGDYWFYNINVTTQTWQNSSIFNQEPLCTYGPDYGNYTGACDCTVWYHVVGIAIPVKFLESLSGNSNPLTDAAYVLIGEGETYNRAQIPTDSEPGYVAKVALTTNSIGVNIRNIPFQPCIFADDPNKEPREEDSIIAWTWRKFIDNPSQGDLPLRNPMTKSVVKVLDAVQDLVWEAHGANLARFCVTGASKRGWTSWTVAAVDYERVTCTMPVMMDTLNLVKVLHNHYRSLGNWTLAFWSYYKPPFHILGDLDADGTKQLQDIVDPYSYRERYGDKLVNYIHMSNDEFFLPDDTWFYWDGIGAAPQPNFYQVCTNYGHEWNHARFDIMQKSIGLYYQYMAGKELPYVYFKRWGGQLKGKVEIRSTSEIIKATVYTARSVKGKRDFRRFGLDLQCTKTHLTDPDFPCEEVPDYLPDITGWSATSVNFTKHDEGYFFSNYVFSLPEADRIVSDSSYYYAYFLEVEIAGPNDLQANSVYKNVYTFSSQIGITPERVPFADCGVQPGTDCQQYLT